MTRHEMLRRSLEETALKERIIAQQSCDDVRLRLDQTDEKEYLLYVDLIRRIDGENITLLSCGFEFSLSEQNTLELLTIRFYEIDCSKEAKMAAEIFETIEDFLKSSLN